MPLKHHEFQGDWNYTRGLGTEAETGQERGGSAHHDKWPAPATLVRAGATSRPAAKERAAATSQCGDHPIRHHVAGDDSEHRGVRARSWPRGKRGQLT